MDGSKHPLFVYLLTDSTCVNNPSNHSLVPYVGLSSNPVAYLHAHNRDDRRYRSGSQLTKPGAGVYQIELVSGPLYKGGKEFKNACRKGSRKVVSRMLFFGDYARKLQTDSTGDSKPMLYARDPQLMVSLYKRRAAGTLKSASRVTGGESAVAGKRPISLRKAKKSQDSLL